MATENARPTNSMPPVSAAYHPAEGAFDEMFRPDGSARPECSAVTEAVFGRGVDELSKIHASAERMLLRSGVTFNVYGESAGAERIFPFDVVPRAIDSPTWATLESGLIQRVKALNAFVADVYGEGNILKDGIVPRDLIMDSSQYRRGAIGIAPPHGVFITVAGIDLVRDAAGNFCVLEDNVRTPSGVSYVIENRLMLARLMPDLLRECRVKSVERYLADLLESLAELAPAGIDHPTIALLTPGPYNSAFFEHVFLSQRMGIELVEGRDLVCMDHKLWMKTVYGPKRVHVLYRRIDDDFLDPVVFRPDSMLGVSGLTAAMHAGAVTVANGIGTGVADDKAVFAYTPQMIRYYLGEQPIIPIVDTHLLREHDVRAKVLLNLDRYVVKPTGASGGYGVVIGPRASDEELAKLRTVIERDPKGFIAQPMITLSTHPTLVTQNGGAPKLAPRHVDLRPFVLMGAKPRVLAGGLTRVALREGTLIVNSSQGGGSKDTWVLEAPC
ncbi:MAG TPA: circularly permuted type 2 ATP-grasp protein [Candidatus Binataceae bacterium]|nr:circularly permuted type 2 ATP-grasp protein [Candidatus Binataceae bacterium]